MPRTIKTTTDHDEIRRWVEQWGGIPSAVKNTIPGDKAGVLYIDFPGAVDKDVDEITWDEFFRIFDDQNLALAYEEAPEGTRAPFCQLVDRTTREAVSP